MRNRLERFGLVRHGEAKPELVDRLRLYQPAAGPTRRRWLRVPTLPRPTIPRLFGFTLVELLVVIAILTILISLVTAGAQTARRRGAITKAKATIASIETAIAMYHGDLGAYPASGNDNLVKALTDQEDVPEWQGPYMEMKHDELKDGALVDPWGKPYQYVSVVGGSPKHRPRSYDLYSLGPNGIDDDGMQDDIVNW